MQSRSIAQYCCVYPVYREQNDNVTETSSNCCALCDHESKEFRSVQIEGNAWMNGAVLVGRYGKYNISNLFAVTVLFYVFLNEEHNIISCLYSSFGIDTRLRDGWPRSRNSSPGRGKRLFSTPQRPCRVWGPPNLVFNVYVGALSPGLKR
jgi:hypothetical protein